MIILICHLINAGALMYGGIRDYKYREIPDAVPIILMITGLFIGPGFLPWLCGMILFIALLLLTAKLMRAKLSDCFPGGDFKLVSSLAFSIGFNNTLTVCFLAFLIMSLTAVFNAIQKNKPAKSFPLCSYMAPAYIVFYII